MVSFIRERWAKLRQSLERAVGEETLRAKALRGGAWLGAGSVTEQMCRFGRNMLLTRILAPEAFGTMAIVMSATTVLASLTEVGAREALIQNPRGSEDEHVGAAWWLALCRSIPLYLAVFFCAPFVSRFYGNAELSALLRVAAIGLLFEGATSTRAYAAIKEMKLKKWATVKHGGAIIGVLVTIILAFFIRDVWALVIGSVTEEGCRCLFSYLVCPFVPPLRWDPTALRELWGFSKGIFGLSILNLIFMRTDIFVLAKLFSPSALGIYAMAVYLVQTPSNFLINLLGQTFMPTYAHIQDDASRINGIFLRSTNYLLVIGMPILVFLVFCGHSVLALLYGPSYSAASSAMVIAAFVALLHVMNSQITTVFYAKGSPGLHRRCVASMAIIVIILIYPLVKTFGIVGGQVACLVAVAVGYLFQLERLGKLTGLDMVRYAGAFRTAGGMSIGMAIMYLLLHDLTDVYRPIPNILVGMTGCAAVYGIAVAIFKVRLGEAA